MKKLLLTISLFLLPTLAFATPSVTTFTYVAGGASPQTINTHNHTSGQTLLVFGGGGSGTFVTSMTWAGTPLVQLGHIGCADGYITAYGLDNATPGGTQNLVITNDLGASHGWGVLTVSGVAASIAGATTTFCGSAGQPSLDVTTTVANSLVIDALQISSGEDPAHTIGANQTSIRTSGGAATGPDSMSYETAASIGTYTMSWTVGGGGWSRAHIDVEVLDGADAPAGGGGSSGVSPGSDMIELIKNGARQIFTSIFPYYKTI